MTHVQLCAGALTVAGQFVYDWFTIKFRQLLENVDGQFARDWVFVPTPTGVDRPPRNIHQIHQYEKTGYGRFTASSLTNLSNS